MVRFLGSKYESIKHYEFLTHQTAEGFRVAIKSAIQLSQYLLNDCKFAYVLTAKMNQDNLEVRYK